RDVLKLIRIDLISQKVDVETELARNLPTVTGDPVQLQQVLVNLVVNGCDAMANCDTPQRRLLIRTGVENRGSAVSVSVTDRGGSVPEEKNGTNIRAFLHYEREGNGAGSFGLPQHHYRASRQTLGHQQSRPRRDVPFHPADRCVGQSRTDHR